MKILIAASEVAPIVKIGGLGDVIGSLPIALQKLGANVDVIVPYYPTAKTENIKVYKAMDLYVPFDNDEQLVEVHKTKLPNSDVDVILLKNAEFFKQGGKKAFKNDRSETEMFSFFSKAVVEYIKSQLNTYDLIHCHDWHTGMVTHLLSEELEQERPATLFTIHNLFYQGTGDVELLRELGIAPGTHQLIDYDIRDGDINFMYQGITSADFVSTVSESYAQEIKTRTYGGKLADTLEARKDNLVGILNGIDYSFFPRDFDKRNYNSVKAKHKAELQKELGLEVSEDTPLFSFISRLDAGQKGLDILHVSMPHMHEQKAHFVLLGTGDPIWEGKFEKLEKYKKYKKKLSINIKFNVDLANKIYSGSDFFMVPSRYEPCGLTQMIAMHYATIPIVRAVGGLKDTVEDGVNGIVFKRYYSLDLNHAIDRAIDLYEDKEAFDVMRKATLEKDFSWDISASKYIDLYKKIIKSRE
jgi:starch synthase